MHDNEIYPHILFAIVPWLCFVIVILSFFLLDSRSKLKDMRERERYVKERDIEYRIAALERNRGK